MNRDYSELIIRGYKLIHFIFTICMFIMAWDKYISTNVGGIANRYNIFIYALYAFLLFFLLRTYNAYMIEYTRIRHIAFALCLSTTISTFAIYFITIIAWNQKYSPYYFLMLFSISIVVNVFWAWSAARLFYAIHQQLKSVVIYRNDYDLERLKGLRELSIKFHVNKYLKNPQTIDEVISSIGDVEAVFITGVNATLRNGIVKYCAEKNIQAFLLPHVGDVLVMSGEHIQSFSVPLMAIAGSNIKFEDMFIKRLSDIIISSIAIIILSPIMIITAIAIKSCDKGPVLYTQDRLTIGGKIFKVYKFRSMRVDAESDGKAVLSTGADDDRVTSVGKFIRMCRIDELPQLFNILKGDMSVVGPRPERPEIASEYEKNLPAFKLRLQVKAGLTGYAQVYGKYNTEPYDKLEMDLIYISRMNLLLDFQIMLSTIPILFRKDSTEGIDNNDRK